MYSKKTYGGKPANTKGSGSGSSSSKPGKSNKQLPKKNATSNAVQHYVFPKTLNTYLGQKGYTILKSELNPEQTTMLRKKLTVIPKSNTPGYSGAQDQSFPAYRESTKKFYVPRYFGIKHFGEAKEIAICEGDDIDVPFVKTLRENQVPVVAAYMKKIEGKQHGGGLLELPCAYGKCLARNTEILMFDGSIKKVQDIVVGDLLMGDDSTARCVLSLAHGREKMVRIYNREWNVNYTVNESHILSLMNKNYSKVDMCIKDFVTIYDEDYKGYRVPCFNFGNDYSTMVSNEEAYIIGKFNGEKILNDKCEFIHKKYLLSSYSARLYFLRGLCEKISMYYSFADITYYKIHLKYNNEEVKSNILFLCRSLGFHVKTTRENEVEKSWAMKSIVIYSSQYINVDILCNPIIFNNNQNLNNESNANISSVDGNKKLIYTDKWNLAYDICWKYLPEDEYYGFEIDGNRRFLLSDFTVTHNTVLSLNIISELKKKTLVIVNKEFLMNQWIERILEFLPSARVGRIQGQIIDIDNKDIVLGMLQSISMKDYDAEIFSSFGLTIIDEVHHISSEVFSRALFKIVSKYMLGLSATMERKDGTTSVFKMFLGDVAFKGEHTEKHNVCVRGIEYVSGDPEFNEVECDFRGQPKYSTMISKLCAFVPRSDFIIRIIRDLFEEEPESQIMILAHNRCLLEYLHDQIAGKNIATVGYYLGGMKERDLKITETKQVVIATYAMAAEALDIKTLSCLVMATPKTDIVQSVGRILRMKHKNPRVIDIIDKHDLFQRQWNQRKRFYKQCNYRIRNIDSTDYKSMILDWDTDRSWNWIFEPAGLRAQKQKNTDVYSSDDDEDEDADADAEGDSDDGDIPSNKSGGCLVKW